MNLFFTSTDVPTGKVDGLTEKAASASDALMSKEMLVVNRPPGVLDVSATEARYSLWGRGQPVLLVCRTGRLQGTPARIVVKPLGQQMRFVERGIGRGSRQNVSVSNGLVC